MTRTTLTLAACAATLAATAGSAAAADPQIPRDIKPPSYFKATFTGSQITTWDYNKPNDPNDPCDISAEGHGSQQLSFKSPKNLKIIASRAPKSQPNFFNTNGRPAVYTMPADLRATVKAEREGDFAQHYADRSETACPGDNGGGVITDEQRPKDCGTRNGSFYLHTAFFTDPDVDGLIIPLPSQQKKPDKDYLTVWGDFYNWADVAHGTYSGDLGSTYDNCPFEVESRADRDGKFYASREKLSEKDLFNPKKKKLTISGSIVAPLKGQYWTGKTILAWNLKLTRVKK